MRLMLMIVGLALALAGCAIQQTPFEKMTAEQIKAANADKSISATCSHGTGPWGLARVVTLQMDKDTIRDGSIGVDPECKLTITTSMPVATPRKAASSP